MYNLEKSDRIVPNPTKPMPTINLQAQLSENDLLEAIKHLPPEELEAFTDKDWHSTNP
ncbi:MULTISPECIES: hypothetical protein [Spirulina sp. CCY15215]|uniref:hypothetical protein n=1 Tax=Spirulina sp. CCY15215 TaxID=2767591 RepID=UPI0019526B90|nr:hypothetical protein [Spirulina major]